jgi:hypothetical protein
MVAIIKKVAKILPQEIPGLMVKNPENNRGELAGFHRLNRRT